MAEGGQPLELDDFVLTSGRGREAPIDIPVGSGNRWAFEQKV